MLVVKTAVDLFPTSMDPLINIISATKGEPQAVAFVSKEHQLRISMIEEYDDGAVVADSCIAVITRVYGSLVEIDDWTETRTHSLSRLPIGAS